MTRSALYAGTFDPVTLGHADIIRRGCRLVDRLVVAVADSSDKKPLFSTQERVEMILAEGGPVSGKSALEARPFDGLLVDLAREEGVDVIIRGLRTMADYAYEAPMTAMNRVMLPGLETVFLAASGETGFISSTLVKQICRMGGDVTPFVSPDVAARLKKRLAAA